MRKYCFFDIESHNSGREWEMEPREFVRTFQYAINDGPVHITTDYDEMVQILEDSDYIVGHNIIAFDLPAIYGNDSFRPLELAQAHKVIDTLYLCHLIHPAPPKFKNINGRYQKAEKPGEMMKFYGLDNLCNYFGLSGKLGNLTELARKYNPPKTLKDDIDYGLIPLDDPDFLAYAEQDVVAVRELYHHLKLILHMNPYDGAYIWREMEILSVNERMSRNGFRLDIEKAKEFSAKARDRRTAILTWLVDEFDFPTEGKSPWASKPGKAAIIAAFASYGITPETRPEWPMGKTGPSLAGDTLKELAEGTDAEDLAVAVAELSGQRALSEQALTYVKPDGKVHFSITALQRSGRFSISKPALTTWSARGKKAIEKSYFVASPGCKLVELDLSNADQRIVAALSGDREYAKRFEPGMDGHEISGRLMYGDEEYEANMLEGWETDDKIRKSNPLREIAKALSHAYAYGAGAKTLARTARKNKALDHISDEELLKLAYRFIDAMNAAYPDNKRWRERVQMEGEKGFVVNTWGRKIPIENRVWNPERKDYYSRSYTQSPAAFGQSGTREILVDGLLRIARDRQDVLSWLVATVHDAVVVDVPESELDWAIDYIRDKVSVTYDPGTPGSQPIFFPLESGVPADNWFEAGH